MTPEQRDSVKRAAAAYEAVLAGRALDPEDAGYQPYSSLPHAVAAFRSVLLYADVPNRQIMVIGRLAYQRDGPDINRFEIAGVIEP